MRRLQRAGADAAAERNDATKPQLTILFCQDAPRSNAAMPTLKIFRYFRATTRFFACYFPRGMLHGL
jgi:hypothetical protein